MAGMIEPIYRMPLCAPSDAISSQLRRTLTTLNIPAGDNSPGA